MSYSITVFRSSTGQSTQSPPERANVGESCRTLKLMIKDLTGGEKAK